MVRFEREQFESPVSFMDGTDAAGMDHAGLEDASTVTGESCYDGCLMTISRSALSVSSAWRRLSGMMRWPAVGSNLIIGVCWGRCSGG